MLCVEDRHIIQTLPPDTPNEPLDIRILPRTARGNDHLKIHGVRFHHDIRWNLEILKVTHEGLNAAQDALPAQAVVPG